MKKGKINIVYKCKKVVFSKKSGKNNQNSYTVHNICREIGVNFHQNFEGRLNTTSN